MAARLVGERRGKPRKQVDLLVLCWSGTPTRLVNISSFGAELEATANRPEKGTLVKIQLDSPAIELEGRVVRRTDEGFAIQFRSVPKEVADWIDGLP